jgi:hypothetical protein
MYIKFNKNPYNYPLGKAIPKLDIMNMVLKLDSLGKQREKNTLMKDINRCIGLEMKLHTYFNNVEISKYSKKLLIVILKTSYLCFNLKLCNYCVVTK